MEVRITTRALTFAVMETFIPNQIATVAVDPIPTILDHMFVAMETSSVNPAAANIVVEAIITTQVPSAAAAASCIVHHLVMVAVVPPCIGIHHMYAACTTCYQNRILPTLAVATQEPTTPEVTCAAMVIYAQNTRALHVVEQSTTIPLLISVVATTCC